MGTNELVASAFPLALAVVLVSVGLVGSRLRAPHRRAVERFVLSPLLVFAVIGLGVYVVIERRWADGLWLLPGALAIIWIWRRPSPGRRDNPGSA